MVQKDIYYVIIKNVDTIDYNKERMIFKEIMNNENIINEIKKNIHIDNNILGDLEKANTLDKKSNEYKELKEE